MSEREDGKGAATVVAGGSACGTMSVAGKRRTEYDLTAPRLEACPSETRRLSLEGKLR